MINYLIRSLEGGKKGNSITEQVTTAGSNEQIRKVEKFPLI